MFYKPFVVKSNTSIKNSERRALREKIRKQLPRLHEDEVVVLVPSKEDIKVIKVRTHSEELVVIYVRNKCPFAFEFSNTIFPTVYMLWQYPHALPFFITWQPVFAKLKGGADLMLPGVVTENPINDLPRLVKGEVCGVCTTENGAAIAVGYTTMSTEDMISGEMRGKGVYICHTFRDQLWEFGRKELPPSLEIPLPFIHKCPSALPEISASEAVMEKGNSADNVNTLAETMNSLVIPEGTSERVVSDDEQSDHVLPNELAVCSDKNARESMDELLMRCFLNALKTKLKDSDLPILCSTFYRNFVQSSVDEDEELNVGKTSYKKVGVFLEAMVARGLITLSSPTKGVLTLDTFNKDHPDVRRFKAIKKDIPSPVAEEVSSKAPVVETLVRVNKRVSCIFSDIGVAFNSFLTMQQFRDCIRQYVEKNNLKSGAAVLMEPNIASLVLKPGESANQMQWNKLNDRLWEKMSHYCSLKLYGDPEPRIMNGSVPHIRIKVEQRSGNKKVTLISGLDVFGLNLRDLQHDVMKSMGCGATVEGAVLLIHGKKQTQISKHLIEKYQIPQRFISMSS